MFLLFVQSERDFRVIDTVYTVYFCYLYSLNVISVSLILCFHCVVLLFVGLQSKRDFRVIDTVFTV